MTFLFYRDNSDSRYGNVSQRNAVLASGANEGAARAAANASVIDGGTRCHDQWPALEIAGADDLAEPIWFRGTAVEPLQKNAGR